MSAQSITGLGLCLLIALMAVAVAVRTGVDLENLEFSDPTGGLAGGLPPGQPAPDFSLTDVAGQSVRLSDHRGQVVLIDFWATWCSPCLKDLPHIQRLHQQYADQGLRVLAVSTDQRRDLVRPFLEKNGYTFAAPLAYGTSVQADYQVRGIPTRYLLDRRGVVRFHHVGYSPGAADRLEREIRQLLAERF